MQEDLHQGDQDVERTAALGGGQLVDAVQQRSGQGERHRSGVARSTRRTRGARSTSGAEEARQARPGGRTREVFRPEALSRAVLVIGISGSDRIFRILRNGRNGRDFLIVRKRACILQAHEAPMSDEHD
nr:hypothetical protein KPHV_02830 [Kitasatospora purpeofusca]